MNTFKTLDDLKARITQLRQEAHCYRQASNPLAAAACEQEADRWAAEYRRRALEVAKHGGR